MKILITGISGFVGRHLTAQILREGHHEIIGVVQEPRDAESLAPAAGSLEFRAADVSEYDDIGSVVRQTKPEIVFHLAAIAFSPAALESAQNTFRTNIGGTANVLESVRSLETRPRVVVVSSGTVYGDAGDATRPHTEDSPLQPLDPYAASKASADLLAQAYRRTFDLNVVIARPFNQTGPGQPPQYVCASIAKQLAEFSRSGGKPTLHLGNIDVERDFSDVRDVVRALWILGKGASNHSVYNVCSETTTSLRTIINMFHHISGISPELVTDKGKIRSQDLKVLAGSAARLREETGWIPAYDLQTTLSDLYKSFQTTKE